MCGLLAPPNHASWVSTDNCSGWYVLRNYSAGCDHGAITDSDPWKDDRSRPDPHVVANRNGAWLVIALFDHRCVGVLERVVPSDDDDVRAHHDVASDRDWSVQPAVDADARPVTYGDILAGPEERTVLDVDMAAGGLKERCRDEPTCASPYAAARGGRRWKPTNSAGVEREQRELSQCQLRHCSRGGCTRRGPKTKRVCVAREIRHERLTPGAER
jgi:hypothetical protein